MHAARLAVYAAKLPLLLTFVFVSSNGCSSDSAAVSGGAGVAGAITESSGAGGMSAGLAGASSARAPDEAGEGGTSAGGDSATVTADVIPDFNGCTTDAYQDQRARDASRTIAIASMGLSFTPKCLLVAIGQTVRWEGALSAHPLAPGNSDHPDAGTANSPIVATSSGTSVEFKFDAAGTFPYECQVHSFGDGKGMAGVVHVAP